MREFSQRRGVGHCRFERTPSLRKDTGVTFYEHKMDLQEMDLLEPSLALTAKIPASFLKNIWIFF